jgi:hypothetical protein
MENALAFRFSVCAYSPCWFRICAAMARLVLMGLLGRHESSFRSQPPEAHGLRSDLVEHGFSDFQAPQPTPELTPSAAGMHPKPIQVELAK